MNARSHDLQRSRKSSSPSIELRGPHLQPLPAISFSRPHPVAHTVSHMCAIQQVHNDSQREFGRLGAVGGEMCFGVGRWLGMGR